MSLPAASTLPALDLAYGGEPFVNVSAKSAATPVGMDGPHFRGEPFYSQGAASAPPPPAAGRPQVFVVCM